LLKLDSEAKAADATILLGSGYGPGETNLLLKHAASQLDTVEDLRILLTYNLVGMISFFGIEDPGNAASEMRRTGRVNASWETVMNWGGGRVCIFRNKKLMDVDPSKHQEEIDLPGAGRVAFFPVGGTEVVTIPHFLRKVESVAFMMSVFPPQVSGLYLNIADRIRKKEIDPREAAILFHEGVAAKMREKEASPSWKEPEIDLRAVATGTKDGKRVRYSCWPSWGWAGASSALTVAALRILRGDVKERGVLAPEACFDPVDFFREAALLVSKDSKDRQLLMESFEELH
jgi:saccharopine dehydrogenase-like NADP-dependent oxidoreductase